MSISQAAQVVQTELSRKLQTLYNLNFKNRSGRHRPDFKKWVRGAQGITFWDNALDYEVEGKTLQVKWEVVKDQVTNITFPHPEYLEQLSDFLQQYIWGTE